MAAQIEARDKRIEKLQSEYKALQARKSSDVQASTDDERLALFKKLEPLATQLPTLHQSVKEGAEVSAGDVLELLAPLDELLADLGFTQIGEAGAESSFDPTHHRAVGKGARSVKPGDRVATRYVGYLHEDKVVVKAQVTAT
jgi:molecular chaperone GrpE (heat shock protein)